jgi:demethylmenaquinone methyltransferase/2-methoxy-6-polyprenyl-1,4-benzoquinol methylase
VEVRAEKITPYDNNRGKAEQVKEMFDSIAPAYDFMNRAMTMGIDKLWRRRAVKMITARKPQSILDVATGTGDLAIKLARCIPDATITGIDLSQGMVSIGNQKVAQAGLEKRVSLGVADCLNLPMEQATFDCVTVAYGVRNFEHLLDGYREMYRVLKDGGMLCVIELSTPTSPIIRPLYDLYTKHIIPLVGKLVSKDVRAYSYLPESIAAVPQGNDMLSLMKEAGFSHTSFKRMTFGTCTIYIGTK